MGMCCCGSRGEPSDLRTCEQIGCDYSEDPETSCLAPEGICALPRAVAAHLQEVGRGDAVVLLAAGGTFAGLYDLRDEVLRRSPVGRELLEHYGAHAERVIAVVGKDRALLAETLRVFLMGAAIGRAVLRTHLGLRATRRYTPQAHASVMDLLARLEREIGDSSLDDAVAFFRREFEPLVGRTPRRILAALRVEDES